jgi:hypothetical protein
MKVRLMGVAAFVCSLAAAPIAHASDVQEAPLVNAERVTIQGQHVPGGCRYESKVVLRPGEAAIEQHELSEDPSTCTMVVEQGTPTDASAAEEGEEFASLSESEQLTVQSGGGASIMSTTRSAGYFKTWLEDPVGIDVNSVENAIEWSWDNPYLTEGSVANCDASYQWYTPSGWGLHENDLQCNVDSPTYPQSWVDSTSYVHYKNGIFCAFTDTDAYYDRNHAYGYGNGDLVGAVTATKTGTCSGLLSFNTQLERTMN